MNVFDEMASRYDTEERAQVANIIAGALRPRLQNHKSKAGIDYGCGTGLVGLQLAGCFQSLLLVDASQQMIEQVRHKLKQSQIQNADTLCSDFSKGLPPGLCADTVFMAQVLLHIPDVQRILARLYSLLRPGGQLLIVDFNKEESIVSDKVHNGFVQQQLMQQVRQAGFAKVEAETFYHGSKIFMHRDASLFLLEAEK